jgi:hypothetical protein
MLIAGVQPICPAFGVEKETGGNVGKLVPVLKILQARRDHPETIFARE